MSPYQGPSRLQELGILHSLNSIHWPFDQHLFFKAFSYSIWDWSAAFIALLISTRIFVPSCSAFIAFMISITCPLNYGHSIWSIVFCCIVTMYIRQTPTECIVRCCLRRDCLLLTVLWVFFPSIICTCMLSVFASVFWCIVTRYTRAKPNWVHCLLLTVLWVFFPHLLF